MAPYLADSYTYCCGGTISQMKMLGSSQTVSAHFQALLGLALSVKLATAQFSPVARLLGSAMEPGM